MHRKTALNFLLHPLSLIALLFLSSSCFGFAGNLVEIEIITETSSKLIRVDAQATSFLVIKERGLVDIRGLDKLKRLEKVTFDICSIRNGLGFLASNNNISVLVISFCQGLENLSFLSELPQLEQLVLRSLRINADETDLSINTRMKYLEFSNCRFSDLSIFKRLPSSLTYLNLSYNEGLPDFNYFLGKSVHVPYIIINPSQHGGPKEVPPNLYLGINPWEIIPKKYFHESS